MAGSLVISNGHVIDTESRVDQVMDLFINDGRIAQLGHIDSSSPPLPTLDFSTDEDKPDDNVIDDDDEKGKVFDATGCYVTAGLLDCHVHGYQYATPLGIDVDERCLARGVTSVVDAGSTGSSTFMGLRKLIAERCKTRIFAFLHIAQHGLASAGCAGLVVGGECDSLNVVNTKACCDVINSNRDMLIGVKVRLAISITDEGKNEQEIYHRSLEASQVCQVPLMVHHALSTVNLDGGNDDLLVCPGSLRKGDIYTHCFHGLHPYILDPETGTVRKSFWEAKRRGVLFDVGHGQGSFSWRSAEQSTREGFWPDTISTDLHMENQNGPAYDLMCVMTKMLYIGMPVQEIIAAVTSKPAAAIGKSDEVGSLAIGRRADVTVFKVVNLDIPVRLEDSFGETREITKAFQPVVVFLNGEEFPVLTERPWPNAKIATECRARFSNYKK